MVTALSTGYEAAVNPPLEFHIDNEYNQLNNKIILSIHMYAPYELVMFLDMKNTEFTEEYRLQLYDNFKQSFRKYAIKRIHVYIDEMGKYYMDSWVRL